MKQVDRKVLLPAQLTSQYELTTEKPQPQEAAGVSSVCTIPAAQVPLCT